MSRDPDIIGDAPPPRDETAGLPMFEGTGPLIIKAAMRGVGGRARVLARERLAPHLRGNRGKVWHTLVALGPMTRDVLAQKAGLSENSINGRVKELVDMGRARIIGLDQGKARGIVEAILEHGEPK